jgi:hypothetical protein
MGSGEDVSVKKDGVGVRLLGSGREKKHNGIGRREKASVEVDHGSECINWCSGL